MKSVVQINTQKIVVFHSTSRSHFKAHVSVSVLTAEASLLSFGYFVSVKVKSHFKQAQNNFKIIFYSHGDII